MNDLNLTPPQYVKSPLPHYDIFINIHLLQFIATTLQLETGD